MFIHLHISFTGLYETSNDRRPTCQGGLTTMQLIEAVNSNTVSDNCIVMVGTNDILRATSQQISSRELIFNINSLLEILNARTKRLVVITLPPVPKLGYRGHLKLWKNTVHCVRGWSGRLGVTVVITNDIFFPRRIFCHSCYERQLRDGRPDGVHWNHVGMMQVLNRLHNCCS